MEEKFKTFKELALYTVEDNKEFLYHLRYSSNLFDCSAYYISEKQWNSHYINKWYVIFTREGVK